MTSSTARRLPDRLLPAVAVALLALAVFYTLYFAAGLFIPIALSIVLSFVLVPAVHAAQKLGFPRLLTACILISLMVGTVSAGAYQLATPAANWLRSAPTSINDVRANLENLSTSFADVREAAEAVEEAVQGIASDATPAQVVEIKSPRWLDIVIGRLPYLLSAFAIAMVLTIFLLAWGEDLIYAYSAICQRCGARRRLIVTISRMQRDVARYLSAVSVINVLLGVTVWIAMHWIGLPNAPLWGTLAGVANFAPYLGPAVIAIGLLVSGISEFDTWPAALIPATSFLVITTVEGQLLTPAILGRRLSLPPPIIFVSVLLFGWMWGVVGALIAVPLTVMLRWVSILAIRRISRKAPSRPNSTTDRQFDRDAEIQDPRVTPLEPARDQHVYGITASN
jgi:predicted PurR-regulated permease PerM